MPEKNKKVNEEKLAEMLTDRYRRPMWKSVFRLFGFFVLLVLPFVLIKADMELMPLHPQHAVRHLLIDAFLILVDLSMLVPIIFEVHSALVAPDKLTLRTIFWKSSIPYGEIIAFQTPRVWQFALLRTKRCFYLINKKDIQRCDELVKSILDKAPHLATSQGK